MIVIDNKSECCGCYSCVNICPKQCIRMEEDEEGFSYPQIDYQMCIKCGKCEEVCPIKLHTMKDENIEQQAVVLQHKDSKICRESTAGGAFTSIAEYVIEQGGIVYGVEMSSDFDVRHISVEKKDELYKFRNSKYVQSNVGDVYKKIKEELNNNRLVCFSGTPCQIEGLRCYLKRKYENLILVDVVCRAVPSPGIWKKYIEMEKKHLGEIKDVRFRDKTLGYQYSTMQLTTKKGKVYRGGIESQPWLRMFFSGMIIRPSCSECKFRSKNRNSDFTIWDCFNVSSLTKDINENVGATRMLIHTPKGRNIFDKIKEDFQYIYLDVDVAINGVKEFYDSPSRHKKSKCFYEDIKKDKFEDVVNKYFPNSFSVRFKRSCRMILNKVGLDIVVKRIKRRMK